MKRILLSFAVLGILAAGLSGAYAAMEMKTAIIPANDVKWTPGTGAMAGTQVAVLYGDPNAKGGQYTMRIKLSDGTKLPAHYHTDLEQVTVISGTFMLGLGDSNDWTKTTALGPGSFAALPANVHHYGTVKGETVVELHGIGPVSMEMAKGSSM